MSNFTNKKIITTGTRKIRTSVILLAKFTSTNLPGMENLKHKPSFPLCASKEKQ
jgi:hypothetical protein